MKVIVGFGSLAESLLSFVKDTKDVFVFSRNKGKIIEGQKEYSFIKIADEDVLKKAKHILICLPSSSYQSFFESYGPELHPNVKLYSFATVLMKEDVINLAGNKNIIPCKCFGQAEQMKLDQKGMLLIPKGLERERAWIRQFFDERIDIVEGDEETALYVNQEATKAALIMVTDLKNKLRNMNIDPRVIDHTIEITTRGVISSYVKSELGGFGKQLLKDIENNRGV